MRLKISSRVHYHKQAAQTLVERVRKLDFIQSLELYIDDEAIQLTTTFSGQKTCYRHSFTDPTLQRRARQKNQALLRACNSKKKDISTVIDLTAGWGRDSLILASHGQQVTMIEQHPLLFACIDYLLVIARDSDEPEVFNTLNLYHGNGLHYLQASSEIADCLYLDPMFPVHKSTARPGKELQLLQLLTCNIDMERLFELALIKARKRVVVKRPLHAPPISDHTPDIQYREKTIRFDVYLT